MPGYKKRNRLRMSPILHPTDFADFALLYKIVCCLAIARQQLSPKITYPVLERNAILADIRVENTMKTKVTNRNIRR